MEDVISLSEKKVVEAKIQLTEPATLEIFQQGLETQGPFKSRSSRDSLRKNT